MQQKTVLIVDDHPTFREGLKAILTQSPALKVVGEAGSYEEAVRCTKKLEPDLLVVDVSLPKRDGIQLTRELRELRPEAAVLIVSVHARAEFIVAAFKAGARGYVAKDVPPQKLLQGIETILKGEYFLDGVASDAVIHHLIDSSEQRTSITDERYNELSPREQQVLRLLAEGRSAKSIASELFISRKTVENHRANIMNKLHLASLVELIRYAARIGLIDPEAWKD